MMSTYSVSGNASDERELHAIRARLEAAENGGDAEAIARVLADDAVIMVPDEPVQEGGVVCAAFVRHMLSETLGYFNRHITYVSREVRAIGDVAFDRGTFSFNVQPKSGGTMSESSGKYFWLYSRSADGTWKLARVIMSLDEAERKEDGEPRC